MGLARFAAITAALSLIFVSLSAAQTNGSKLVYELEFGKVSYREYKVYSSDTQYPEDDSRIGDDIRFTLQRKAEFSGRTKLLKTLGELVLNSESTVAEEMQKDKGLMAALLSFSGEYSLEGISYPGRGVSVELSLPLLGEGGFISILYKTAKFRKVFPAVTHKYADADYNVLVIDARGFDYNPAVFPSIYDVQGRHVYGVEFVDSKALTKRGLVRFVEDINELDSVLKGIADESGLKLKPYHAAAWDILGRSSCDILISDEDSQIILSNPAMRKSLKECRVVVLID